jgi:hypothetical protein
MRFEKIGKLDIPDGLEVVQSCLIRDSWYMLAKHPGEGHIYTLYKVNLEDASCTPAEIL